MTRHIRNFLSLLVSLGAVAAFAPTTASVAAPPTRACTPPPAADVTTPEGWLGYLADHPNDTAYVVTDGRGHVVRHRAGHRQPTASAIKVLHLAAYARAVAAGDLDPRQRVTLADWERWWVPGTDGGAHLAALDRLGIAADAGGARDGSRTVTVRQMVTAMMRESDNAVPDYLRALLGDGALRRAAAAADWDLGRLPTLAGQTINLLVPEIDEHERWAAARRYATSPAYREQVLDRQVDPDRVRPWVRTTFSATPAQLAGVYEAITEGKVGGGSTIALRELEWQGAPEGLRGLGFKSGSLPGVITDGFEARRKDGTVAIAVQLTRDLSDQDMMAALEAKLPEQQLFVAAMLTPETLRHLRCVA